VRDPKRPSLGDSPQLETHDTKHDVGSCSAGKEKDGNADCFQSMSFSLLSTKKEKPDDEVLLHISYFARLHSLLREEKLVRKKSERN